MILVTLWHSLNMQWSWCAESASHMRILAFWDISLSCIAVFPFCVWERDSSGFVWSDWFPLNSSANAILIPCNENLAGFSDVVLHVVLHLTEDSMELSLIWLFFFSSLYFSITRPWGRSSLFNVPVHHLPQLLQMRRVENQHGVNEVEWMTTMKHESPHCVHQLWGPPGNESLSISLLSLPLTIAYRGSPLQ